MHELYYTNASSFSPPFFGPALCLHSCSGDVHVPSHLMYGLQLLIREIERAYRQLLAGPRSRTYNIQYVLTSISISITHLTYIHRTQGQSRHGNDARIGTKDYSGIAPGWCIGPGERTNERWEKGDGKRQSGWLHRRCPKGTTDDGEASYIRGRLRTRRSAKQREREAKKRADVKWNEGEVWATAVDRWCSFWVWFGLTSG